MTDYRTLPPTYVEEALRRVLAALPAYGIRVSFSDELPTAASASFNGEHITVSVRANQEVALFTLIHVFGHIIQVAIGEWTYPEEGGALQPLSESELLQLKNKEREASEYALGFLHSLGITELDQWVSDIWQWDWQYVEAVYTEGVGPSPALEYDYVKIPYGQPTLKPRPIPPFTVKSFPTQLVF